MHNIYQLLVYFELSKVHNVLHFKVIFIVYLPIRNVQKSPPLCVACLALYMCIPEYINEIIIISLAKGAYVFFTYLAKGAYIFGISLVCLFVCLWTLLTTLSTDLD